MRRTLLVAVLLVIASGAFGHGRSRLHATGGVYAWIDMPYQGQSVAAGSFYIAGWAFSCDTGGNPSHPFVIFVNRATEEGFVPGSTTYVGLYRPDVAAAFGSTCPAVGNYTGYHYYPDSVPPGDYRVYVYWSDGVDTIYTTVDVTLT